MTTIGILGTGRMRTHLARRFAEVGQQVVLGSRDPESSKQLLQQWGGSNIVSGNYTDAADAEFVLPAIFLCDGALDAFEGLRPRLDGKIFIDISNPFNADYSDFILPWDTSAAEHIQHRFLKTRVIGAFKNV
jgi:8-hydroxy-5-deazaflavin:NADPH oxidoreductase